MGVLRPKIGPILTFFIIISMSWLGPTPERSFNINGLAWPDPRAERDLLAWSDPRRFPGVYPRRNSFGMFKHPGISLIY